MMSAELDMMQARGKWAAKLAKAQGQVKNVPKSERNKEQNYNFATAEKIFEMVRPILAAVGLAVLPDAPSVEYTPEAGRSKSGTPYASARARLAFTLIDTDTGYSETTYFEGYGMDYGDKAIPKALTMCAKHWARVTFMIDLQDDAEADSPRAIQKLAQPAAPAAKPAPAPRPQAAPPAPSAPTAPANGGIFDGVTDIPDTLPTGASAFVALVDQERTKLGRAPYGQPVVLYGLLKRDMPDGNFDWGMLKDPGAARVAYRIAIEHIRASEAA